MQWIPEGTVHADPGAQAPGQAAGGSGVPKGRYTQIPERKLRVGAGGRKFAEKGFRKT